MELKSDLIFFSLASCASFVVYHYKEFECYFSHMFLPRFTYAHLLNPCKGLLGSWMYTCIRVIPAHICFLNTYNYVIRSGTCTRYLECRHLNGEKNSPKSSHLITFLCKDYKSRFVFGAHYDEGRIFGAINRIFEWGELARRSAGNFNCIEHTTGKSGMQLEGI